jgi:hypothetical protein
LTGEGVGSIRSYLGDIKGRRVVEVTCDDEYKRQAITDPFDGSEAEVKVKCVYLHFDNGHTLTFQTIEDQLGFNYDGDT